ncbi:hypothetical protein G4B88_023725 [Cannabis sativa]|uniref:Uncharacterized protein n=1 Tax=Cannabis sativa TaxID=3483 RepID=A0A7J6HWG6_CANSA|nr:hypothetical protein G4B88_023725 [Cannabis sativa]
MNHSESTELEAIQVEVDKLDGIFNHDHLNKQICMKPRTRIRLRTGEILDPHGPYLPMLNKEIINPKP